MSDKPTKPTTWGWSAPSLKPWWPAGAELPAPADGVPAWVRRRQTSAANALDFEPPKRDKALPLTEEDITNTLATSFAVVEAYELDSLDVWFVLARSVSKYDYYKIILYEHKGEWVCSSITLVPSDIRWDLADRTDRNVFYTGQWASEEKS